MAQRAGVSHALVLHHFGTKESLRQACDELVTSTGQWLEQGVRECWVQPSDDPPARAAMYVTWLLAPLAFGEHLARSQGVGDVHDTRTLLRFSRAGIELFTRGVFADERALKAWDAVRDERGPQRGS
ncbi:hypothetical protein [Nonomuraea fuscirosea]|uniref:hypothetical protein n=1 Tax=Nonomuraea fuscirosea TaxID=1291556 RepID=UPI00341E8188